MLEIVPQMFFQYWYKKAPNVLKKISGKDGMKS
jgi:hypothetical protein